jgi:hypothetical protein
MKFTSKVLLATTSVVALTGAAQAQQVLIDQQVTGTNVLNSGNTAKLINSPGFGAVTLQAFQDAANAVNTGSAVYGSNNPPGSVTQSVNSGASLAVTTNNTIAGFSSNGTQLVLGSQGIGTNINAAGLTLGNGAAVTVQQGNPGSTITPTQKNVMSAGYNYDGTSSSFTIGQGPAAIQGQSIGTGGVINNTGFQNNGFNLNTAAIGVLGASATVGVAQKPGAITSIQTNFADAGQASPTFIDPSITALNQTVTANVNQINSIGAASGSTLILDGAGSTVGVQSIGGLAGVTDSFTVQNAARALTWGSTTANTGASYGSTSGGTGDVSIKSSAQTVGLDFNGIVAGTTATPQNVNFGGTSAGLFEQKATYGSASTTGQGIIIANQPVGGFANFGANGATGSAPTINNAVNLSLASTADGAANLTDVGQIASASLNSALVTGAVNGNLTQTANINTTNTSSASAAVGTGPQLSNFAGAVVQAQGPASLSNVDQSSVLGSNTVAAASVGADGLQLNQSGYQAAAAGFSATNSPGQVNAGLSSKILVAKTASSTTLGSNATVAGSQQQLSNQQNTFAATNSAGNVTLSQTTDTGATLSQAYGGDNLALANASSGGSGSLSNGSQLGNVNLNSAAIGTTGAGTQTAITQTAADASPTLTVAGFNTATASGKTATVTGYGQAYNVALNSVSLGGTGAKDVTQSSGAVTINTGNNLGSDEATTSSPFASTTIGGSLGASQNLSASLNMANIGGVGSLVQTAGPVNSTLNNTASSTVSTSAASGITGLVQTTSQSINTGM